MVGWHHQFNGQEFEQTLVDGEGQGSLACCSPRGHKELDMTERLNRTELRYTRYRINYSVSVSVHLSSDRQD